MTISWLMLERYALGELTGAEREQVERGLAESSADRACLDAILGDATALPPLPEPAPRRRAPGALLWAGAAALAASLALALLRPDAVPSRRSLGDGVKGGEAAVLLVSERTGQAPQSFRDGDRFKLLVTCPAWLASRMEVVVFQGAERYTPLSGTGPAACGNLVPWPGAFALDGDQPVDVCVSWRGRPARSVHELGDEAVCVHLEHQ